MSLYNASWVTLTATLFKYSTHVQAPTAITVQMSRSVLIYKLPHDVTFEELHLLFGAFSPVKSIKIRRSNSMPSPSSMAEVTFIDPHLCLEEVVDCFFGVRFGEFFIDLEIIELENYSVKM